MFPISLRWVVRPAAADKPIGIVWDRIVILSKLFWRLCAFGNSDMNVGFRRTFSREYCWNGSPKTRCTRGAAIVVNRTMVDFDSSQYSLTRGDRMILDLRVYESPPWMALMLQVTPEINEEVGLGYFKCLSMRCKSLSYCRVLSLTQYNVYYNVYPLQWDVLPSESECSHRARHSRIPHWCFLDSAIVESISPLWGICPSH